MNKNLCYCCNNELTPVGKYYICHHCKTVAFTEEIPFEEKCNAINKFLDDVQKKILAEPQWLAELNSRHKFAKELTTEEQAVCDRLYEFQSVRCILIHETKVVCGDNSGIPCRKKKALPCTRGDASMKIIKMALYRLLMISDWLKEKFEIEE